MDEYVDHLEITCGSGELRVLLASKDTREPGILVHIMNLVNTACSKKRKFKDGVY